MGTEVDPRTGVFFLIYKNFIVKEILTTGRHSIPICSDDNGRLTIGCQPRRRHPIDLTETTNFINHFFRFFQFLGSRMGGDWLGRGMGKSTHQDIWDFVTRESKRCRNYTVIPTMSHLPWYTKEFLVFGWERIEKYAERIRFLSPCWSLLSPNCSHRNSYLYIAWGRRPHTWRGSKSSGEHGNGTRGVCWTKDLKDWTHVYTEYNHVSPHFW